MERVDDLQINGLTLVQDDGLYAFTGDAVLLSDFVRTRAGDTVCDFGAGTGIISVLLAAKRKNLRVIACEIQPELCALARKNVERNRLSDRVEVREGDVRELFRTLAKPADAVVCNPPYFRKGSSFPNENESKARARHEIDLTLPELCGAAEKVLKNGGRFFACYPAERFCEFVCELRAVGLEVKRARAVQVAAGRAPHLFLAEAHKGGGFGCVWLPPLILREGAGDSAEVAEIYQRENKEDEA